MGTRLLDGSSAMESNTKATCTVCVHFVKSSVTLGCVATRTHEHRGSWAGLARRAVGLDLHAKDLVQAGNDKKGTTTSTTCKAPDGRLNSRAIQQLKTTVNETCKVTCDAMQKLRIRTLGTKDTPNAINNPHRCRLTKNGNETLLPCHVLF